MTSATAPAVEGAVTLDSKLSGVLGGRTASACEKAFGMRTVSDLLSHYPRRYAKRGELTALANLPLDENVTIIAEVLRVQERPMRARRGSILEVKISDGEGILTLSFFNQAWRSRDLVPGVRGIFAGKVSAYRGALQLAHPDYELFEPDSPDAVLPGGAAAKEWAQTPIPIYPATSTVASWQVQKAVGAVGTVYITVPARKAAGGQVVVNFSGRQETFAALTGTDPGSHAEAAPTARAGAVAARCPGGMGRQHALGSLVGGRVPGRHEWKTRGSCQLRSARPAPAWAILAHRALAHHRTRGQLPPLLRRQHAGRRAHGEAGSL